MIEATSSDTTEESVEFQRSISDGFSDVGGAQQSSSKNLRLYCFACHRLEYHYNALKGTYYHHLLVGLTFGLAWLFGPYRCRCCGYRRLARFNILNLKYHYHRWKYAKGSSSNNSTSRSKRSRSDKPENSSSKAQENRLSIIGQEDEVLRLDELESKSSQSRRRRRKKKLLKAVPVIDSIGKERRARQRVEELTQPAQHGAVNFSIDGIVESFETEESRKERLERIAEERATRGPFEAKKAKPRKKYKGKPKRRFAKKERLTGPEVYCFTCKQNNEHFHVLKGSAYYSFLFGITFGLSAFVGPFRCSVCSRKRLLGSDLLNPKWYVRELLSNSKNGYGS